MGVPSALFMRQTGMEIGVWGDLQFLEMQRLECFTPFTLFSASVIFAEFNEVWFEKKSASNSDYAWTKTDLHSELCACADAKSAHYCCFN